MGEAWDIPLQRAVDQHLAMCVRQMLLGANHVRDLHVVVVHHHREVVGRQTIGPHQDEVAERLLLPGHLAADHVVDGHVAVVGNVKADRVRRVVVAAMDPALQVVVRRTSCRFGRLALLLQLLFGAVAAVGDVSRDQFVDDFAVPLDTLRLSIRRVGPADVGPFVPLQPQPAEIIEHHLLRPARGARHIGIFDSDDELATMMAGEEPVEDRRARATDMQVAGGRRRESDAGHGWSRTVSITCDALCWPMPPDFSFSS